MAQTATPIKLKQETLQAFEAYIRGAEAGMEQTVNGGDQFLWADANPERSRQVRDGNVAAEFWSGRGPVKVPNGLIHDWIGAALIPGVAVEDVLTLVQDYDNHKNIYKPEVVASRLISHHDNDFQIYLRLLKKKIITVILDTDHDVHYRSLDRTHWTCRSYTTRIAEVEDAGTPKERVLPPDTGYGFLWRLYSYWQFQEREGGVYLECRAISLTRDVPLGLGWIIEPIIQKLPKESLIHTLEATRQALIALVRNALDASPPGHAVVVSAASGDGKLRLSVGDSGAGMKPEVLNRVAEPFFTTKSPGHGMGLGTFLVRVFAASLQGDLVFESEVGQGTRAILELPLLPAAAETETASALRGRLV